MYKRELRVNNKAFRIDGRQEKKLRQPFTSMSANLEQLIIEEIQQYNFFFITCII